MSGRLMELLDEAYQWPEARIGWLTEAITEAKRLEEQFEAQKRRADDLEESYRALHRQWADLADERDSLMADSWRAFAESGGDTDGDLKWHCTPAMAGMQLVDAVKALREDYDEALRESNPARVSERDTGSRAEEPGEPPHPDSADASRSETPASSPASEPETK